MTATFGTKIDRVEYVVREGAYAVIVDDKSVAAIQGGGGFYLPGGGIEVNENHNTTLVRELEEECGASIEILDLIGQATDFLFSPTENCHFEKRGTFYRGRFTSRPNQNLVWVPVLESAKLFRQQGHAWAVLNALVH